MSILAWLLLIKLWQDISMDDNGKTADKTTLGTMTVDGTLVVSIELTELDTTTKCERK